MAIPRFERLFRNAASINIDKQDIKRFSAFVNDKLHDLLTRGEEIAKAPGRDTIYLFDLPITIGLRNSTKAFEAMDQTLELQPILDHLAARPPLDLDYSKETKARFP